MERDKDAIVRCEQIDNKRRLIGDDQQLAQRAEARIARSPHRIAQQAAVFGADQIQIRRASGSRALDDNAIETEDGRRLRALNPLDHLL